MTDLIPSPARVAVFRPNSLAATHVALFLVQVGFAVGAVESKLLMGPISASGYAVAPISIAMVRMVGAAIFFHLIAQVRRVELRVSARDHARIAALALLGVVINQGLFLTGLRLTTPLTATLVTSMLPAITAGIAVGLRHERGSKRLALGILLSFFGAVCLTGGGSLDHGALLIGLNIFAYALYTVSSRNVVSRVGSLPFVTWVFTWASLLFAPVGALAVADGVGEWPGAVWGYLALVVLFGTVMAYQFSAWALARSSASTAVIYTYAQPVITALLAWVQLGTTINLRTLLAAPLILGGVAIVATRPVHPVTNDVDSTR